MKKQTKVLIIQFALFALVFLLIRFLISTADLLSGFWLPLASAIAATLLVPQFKVFTIDGKEQVFAAWVFYRKPVLVKWL